MVPSVMDKTNLLSAFAVARGICREAFEAAVRGPYGVSHFDFPKSTMPFAATNSRVRLRSVILNHAYYTAPVRMKMAGRPGIRQPIVYSGQSLVGAGRYKYENSEVGTVIFPPDEECVVECTADFAHLLIEINEENLSRHSFNLNGYAPKGTYKYKPIVSENKFSMMRLGSIATALALNLTDSDVVGSPVIVELEQALISAFLIENKLVEHADATLSAGASAIKILRDYIHANWTRPLTVEDIARECNVSARSVFLRFKEILGISPMNYLRNVRLDQSRCLLIDGDEEVSVMRIALLCGFSNVGHFAQRYKERFGELPSQTVRKAKRARSLIRLV